ncbi:GNAT family N-acetyltransferase [Pseudoduganella violacea]|uniref:GNAT superfamily N-acetyltransferase n=1 Tax=Pseudoduganella violacea TaxID=1715466 RepID=A0A7W5BGI6_9BURK|nr:GNAT family N-acetyltransferase [Pseudoduganella violacea]MBB3121830.1 GNAT superfamily N-acetyltransferase [Pseudoduganella violacea]
MFSSVVNDFWQETFSGDGILYADERLQITTNPTLNGDEHGMILEPRAGKTLITLKPELASRLDIAAGGSWSVDLLCQRLAATGFALYGADNLFYFPAADLATLMQESIPGDIRQLSQDDQGFFAEFSASATEEDLDAAYVELDHWLVFGAFERERLVCAGSMYAWMASNIADFGMLTLPPFRGKGHGRRLVRAISQSALQRGFQPQYRCQLDNHASIATARAAGLHLYGKWDFIVESS